MPYTLQGRCVVNKATGAQVKCHPTKARALKHLAALQANVPEAKAVGEGSATPAPTGGKKLTRAEAARHASLVRWKKESPFAARVQEKLAAIRAKRLGLRKGKGKGKGKAKGGGKGKPKDARTPQEKANQNRAAIAKETGVGDLEGPLVRIGAGMASDLEPEAYGKLESMGLIKRTKDGKAVMTAAGKKWRRAADKGDADGARAALAEGKEKVGALADKERAKADKLTERAKAKAEREKARGARAIARGKRSKGRKEKQRRPIEKEVARIAAARARKSMDELTPILDELKAIRDEALEVIEEEAAVKAGRRNAGSDQALIDQGYELSMQLCDLFESLGASVEEEGEEEDDADMEMEEMKKSLDDGFVLGDAVKALDGGAIGAYAVRFGSIDEPDLSPMRDFFTKSTDFWIDAWDRRPMLFHHAMDEDTADAPRIGTWTKAEIKDEGVWLEGQLDKGHRYYGAIKELVKRGVLRLSSDSAPHLVRREAKGNTHEVKRWPLLAASLTPTPAEPRLTAVSFKALVAELGLNAIESTPEADDTIERDRLDAAKALDDRRRRALMELDLLTLEIDT